MTTANTYGVGLGGPCGIEITTHHDEQGWYWVYSPAFAGDGAIAEQHAGAQLVDGGARQRYQTEIEAVQAAIRERRVDAAYPTPIIRDASTGLWSGRIVAD